MGKPSGSDRGRSTPTDKGFRELDELEGCVRVPKPTASYRRRAWADFQRALDPLAPLKPLRPPRV